MAGYGLSVAADEAGVAGNNDGPGVALGIWESDTVMVWREDGEMWRWAACEDGCGVMVD